MNLGHMLLLRVVCMLAFTEVLPSPGQLAHAWFACISCCMLLPIPTSLLKPLRERCRVETGLMTCTRHWADPSS